MTRVAGSLGGLGFSTAPVISPRRAAGRLVAIIAGVSAGGAGVVALAGFAGLTYAVARFIVTPARDRHERIRVFRVDPDEGTVALTSTADTRLPGRYGFLFDEGRGYARLGDVLSDDGAVVVRRVDAVDEGALHEAKRGRLLGWYYRRPSDLGLPFTEVSVDTDAGPAPAWEIPAADAAPGAPTGDRWAVIVHGRGVVRAETLRAVPPFRDAGFTTLVVSYRNDGEAPASSDGRYGLGLTEWADVEVAIDYAVEHGARSVVLMGWSMGGALVLQTLLRSEHQGVIEGLVLESPVVDWRTTLRYQGDALHLPGPMQKAVLAILGARRLSAITGQAAPIDFDALDLVAGAEKITVPVLILHSDDDGFVPSTASRALALARPDLVTLEDFHVARHTKLWNMEPERFEGAISSWLRGLRPATGRRERSDRR